MKLRNQQLPCGSVKHTIPNKALFSFIDFSLGTWQFWIDWLIWSCIHLFIREFVCLIIQLYSIRSNLAKVYHANVNAKKVVCDCGHNVALKRKMSSNTVRRSKRIAMRCKRALESPSETMVRLEQLRVYAAQKRALESSRETMVRLEKVRTHTARKRALESHFSMVAYGSWLKTCLLGVLTRYLDWEHLQGQYYALPTWWFDSLKFLTLY